MGHLSRLREAVERLTLPAQRELALVAALNAVAESGRAHALRGCLGCRLTADYAGQAAATWPAIDQVISLAREGAGYAAQGSRCGCDRCHLHLEALCGAGVYTLAPPA